jgi:hypothetical protein
MGINIDIKRTLTCILTILMLKQKARKNYLKIEANISLFSESLIAINVKNFVELKKKYFDFLENK